MLPQHFRTIGKQSGGNSATVGILRGCVRLIRICFGVYIATFLMPLHEYTPNMQDGKAPPIIWLMIPKGSQNFIGNPSVNHRGCSGQLIIVTCVHVLILYTNIEIQMTHPAQWTCISPIQINTVSRENKFWINIYMYYNYWGCLFNMASPIIILLVYVNSKFILL